MLKHIDCGFIPAILYRNCGSSTVIILHVSRIYSEGHFNQLHNVGIMLWPTVGTRMLFDHPITFTGQYCNVCRLSFQCKTITTDLSLFRSLESNLFNKSNELQEEISAKRLDLQLAQIHYAAVKAQVSPAGHLKQTQHAAIKCSSIPRKMSSQIIPPRHRLRFIILESTACLPEKSKAICRQS